MKHTPAPWTYVRVNENTLKIKAKRHHLGESVATLTGTFGDDITLADARLIAAAPELLDALKNIKHTVNAAMLYRRINKGVAEDIDETINAAIAKTEEA